MKKFASTSFTYPQDYDLEQAESFIQHFFPYAYFILFDDMKINKKFYGKDLCRSAALEGCFKAYLTSLKLNIDEYEHRKSLCRLCSKRSFWTLARIFGYVPTSGQIYFPKQFVEFQSFFKDKSIPEYIHDECDYKILEKIIEDLPDRESEIMHLYLAGYDFCQIGDYLGVCANAPGKMFKRSIERIKRKIVQPYFTCPICQAQFKNDGNTIPKSCCSFKCERKQAGQKYWKKKNDRRIV